MKYLQSELHLGSNECAGDAVQSEKLIELHLAELQQQIDALPADAPLDDRLHLTLDRGYALLEGNLFDQAWRIARQALDEAVDAQLWLRAVEACDIMFQSDREESVRALAHGIWLGVTFPIDPELSVAMLQHLVDESPDRSDGAAVAAATAGYLVELRADGEQKENLQFFTRQMLGQVARNHSQVEEQEIFDFWVERLELNDPEKFLPRLSLVLDILTDGVWWFEKEQLRAHIPE
ncbi:MAG: hypothetical protein H6964_13580 [Chromatiaceae bacterium]|nr:hypothetical protein [Gammaproteobacteria bacterium]MCP5448007.1 hypothetical protein [Chromatiaceae bacterium]MCB1861308.1 hypothetical protein [Gammaproteobacteria bacterium]MCB1872761.1 hypothetical protein [Gammaproteobacteria bacterium]MCB1879103.1 hypothetical protein [Gammaproteobacteria bacterium]